MQVTPENLQEAIAERDRMAGVLTDFSVGRRDRAELPSDTHEYYGRLKELEPQIQAVHREQQRAEEYDRQMAEAKQRGYDDTRLLVGHTNGQKWTREELQGWTLDELRREAANSRVVAGIKAEQTFDEHDPKQSLLSQDDYIHRYTNGANKAVQEWYFEQKNELQLGRKYMPEQSQERSEHGHSVPQPQPNSEQKNYPAASFFWQVPGSWQPLAQPQIEPAEQCQQQQQHGAFELSR